MVLDVFESSNSLLLDPKNELENRSVGGSIPPLPLSLEVQAISCSLKVGFGKLWPLIRNHCPMHDRFYRLAGVRSQPIAKPNLLLGAGYQDLAKIRAEIA